jgi:double-stranded uracil-DNA glycosylase
LSEQEFIAAAARFGRKTARYAPRYVAFLGKAAYCALSGRRDLAWGFQPETLCGAGVWVLPNPSGRNLAFSFDQLVGAYRQLYQAANRSEPST